MTGLCGLSVEYINSFSLSNIWCSSRNEIDPVRSERGEDGQRGVAGVALLQAAISPKAFVLQSIEQVDAATSCHRRSHPAQCCRDPVVAT